MTQMNNRFFDDFAKTLGDASGMATGMRQEFESMMKNQFQMFAKSMGYVTRDEFDACFELAKSSQEKINTLMARLEALETSSGSPSAPAKSATPTKKSRNTKKGLETGA